jgi:hypothetical protein
MPSHNIASTMMSDDSPHITSGPRYDSMVQAINFSIAALRQPLSADDREYGWDDLLREYVLASYERTLQELELGPVAPGHFKAWGKNFIDGGMDPRTRNQLADDACRGDSAVRDIQYGEDLLGQAEALSTLLTQQLPENEVSDGWTEVLTKALLRALTQIVNRVRSGDYVVREDFINWDVPLQGAGVTRREWFEISYIRATRDRLGLNLDLIESCPPGEWWGMVKAFDYSFVSLTALDLGRDHREPGPLS